MSTFVRHSMFMTGRALRNVSRQPVLVLFTLLQPLVWLLLFGPLFQKVAELPGFGAASYLTHLTPGVIIMTAMFSAGWSGDGFIRDMERGVMDRHLTSPVSRGALISGALAHQVLTTVIQSLIVLVVGLAMGARFDGGIIGVLIVLVAAMLVAIVFAAMSNALALLLRQHEALIGINQFLGFPLVFLSSAMMAPALMPSWVSTVAKANPVEWATVASREALQAGSDWGVIGWQLGWLLGLAIVMSWLATRAFRSYQRSA